MVDAVIRLFVSTATTFQSNGIGYLPDVVSCVVTEERNGTFELEMTYPVTGKWYEELMTRRILVAKSNPFSNPQPFRIYDITKPIKGIVTVCAEHISYDLLGIPVKPFAAPNVIMALKGLKDNALINCPFNFLTDKSTAANYVVPVPSNIRSELGGVQGSILDTYRGEYEFDGYNVNLWNNRGMNRGATIRYGKNLTDLQQEENIENLYTGILPYWYSDLEENGGLVQGTIVNCPDTYNFQRIMILDCSYEFQDKPTVAQLTAFAQSYISNNNVGIPKVSIEVSFVDLGSSEEYQNVASLTTVHLCDTVMVEYPELGVKASGKCIKTKYNVLEDRYNSVEIGDARPDLTSSLASNNDKLAEDFQKKLLSTTGTTKEEFQNKLDDTYTNLLGDITNLESNMNQADQTLQNNINSQGQQLQGNINAAEQKFQNDLAQADKDLKLLIAKTAENEATAREEAIANSTKQITGNLGGYVVLHSSTNADYPDEILVMDSDKVTTAKKIWRWNKSGLGYSATGYNGPYGLAITQDGAIVADYIKAGAINASLITTGFLNASIIHGGTLILGGKNNGNGNFILRDNDNNTIGLMSNAGFSMYKGTIMGPSITIGGLNNTNGTIQVLNSSGAQSGYWAQNGITLRNDGRFAIYGTINYNGGTIDGVLVLSGTQKFQRRLSDSAVTYLEQSTTTFAGVIANPDGTVTNRYTNGYGFYSLENHFTFGKITNKDDGTVKVDDVFSVDMIGGRYSMDALSELKTPLEVYAELYLQPNNDGLTEYNGSINSYLKSKLSLGGGSYIGYNFGNFGLDSVVVTACDRAIFKKYNYYDSIVYAPVQASKFTEESSLRYKKNIRSMTEETAKQILKIRPVIFDYIVEEQGTNCLGVIAEETYEYIPEVVSLDHLGRPDTVEYGKFTPHLIKMVQVLQREVEELKGEIQKLKEGD